MAARLSSRVFLRRVRCQVGEVSFVHSEDPVEVSEVVVRDPARSDRVAGDVALGEELSRAQIDGFSAMKLF